MAADIVLLLLRGQCIISHQRHACIVRSTRRDDATYIPWQVEENDFRDCAEIVRNAGGVCTDEEERILPSSSAANIHRASRKKKGQ